MDKRKKHFAKHRAEEIRIKPPTKAQKRNQMCTYLKNMANYKHSQLKNKSFEEIQIRNPVPSSVVVTKSTSTFPNLFLEETNTFDISESETFCFYLEEPSSGSPTTPSDLSLPDYKAFYIDNDDLKEKRSSGTTTTHVDFSQYDSFIFDLSNDQFPPADRSDFNHKEFADELTHIMSLPNLECFKFKIDPDPGDLTFIDLGIRKNASTTNVNVPLEDDQSSLF
ncbi:hypothetical protein Tco_1481145, partial [Tanacetum coccineum]